MLPGGTRKTCIMYEHMFTGLGLYYADLEKPITTAGEELDYLHYINREIDR